MCCDTLYRTIMCCAVLYGNVLYCTRPLPPVRTRCLKTGVWGPGIRGLPWPGAGACRDLGPACQGPGPGVGPGPGPRPGASGRGLGPNGARATARGQANRTARMSLHFILSYLLVCCLISPLPIGVLISCPSEWRCSVYFMCPLELAL